MLMRGRKSGFLQNVATGVSLGILSRMSWAKQIVWYCLKLLRSSEDTIMSDWLKQQNLFAMQLACISHRNQRSDYLSWPLVVEKCWSSAPSYETTQRHCLRYWWEAWNKGIMRGVIEFKGFTNHNFTLNNCDRSLQCGSFWRLHGSTWSKKWALLSVLTFPSDFSHLTSSVLLSCLERETLEAFTLKTSWVRRGEVVTMMPNNLETVSLGRRQMRRANTESFLILTCGI